MGRPDETLFLARDEMVARRSLLVSQRESLRRHLADVTAMIERLDADIAATDIALATLTTTTLTTLAR